MTAAEQIAEYADKQVWGSDVEEGVRRSYSYMELKRLAEAALRVVPHRGCMVEIGVYGGKSLSALLWVARVMKAEVWAADPFIEKPEMVVPHLERMLPNFADVDLHLYRVTSQQMHDAWPLGKRVHLLHIDGDHHDIGTDCRLWFPELVSGGIAVLHDMVDDPRSPIYDGVCQVWPYIEGWERLWWAQDEEGHQMGVRKP